MVTSRRLGKLGELQPAILQVLGEHGPRPVGEIYPRLRGRRLAYTTVGTTLRKVEELTARYHRRSSQGCEDGSGA